MWAAPAVLCSLSSGTSKTSDAHTPRPQPQAWGWFLAARLGHGSSSSYLRKNVGLRVSGVITERTLSLFTFIL